MTVELYLNGWELFALVVMYDYLTDLTVDDCQSRRHCDGCRRLFINLYHTASTGLLLWVNLCKSQWGQSVSDQLPFKWILFGLDPHTVARMNLCDLAWAGPKESTVVKNVWRPSPYPSAPIESMIASKTTPTIVAEAQQSAIHARMHFHSGRCGIAH